MSIDLKCVEGDNIELIEIYYSHEEVMQWLKICCFPANQRIVNIW